MMDYVGLLNDLVEIHHRAVVGAKTAALYGNSYKELEWWKFADNCMEFIVAISKRVN